MAKETPQTQQITSKDLIGHYVYNDDNTLTKTDGRKFKICRQHNASPKAPKFYLADDNHYISGLFYEAKNHYTLSAQGDNIKLSLTIDQLDYAEIKPYVEPKWLSYKGAK